MMGKTVYQQEVRTDRVELDLSTHANGIYFLLLPSGQSVKVIKN
ncbi:MAG: hypothetical protein ACI9NN_000869 [Bacteroidia bacterium]